MLITTTTVFSQLFVKPNGTTDSYVFVTDEVLFVEQGVNLQVNPNDPTTQASIYLRNGAQLIQGSTVDANGTVNKGTGMLAVDQTVTETSNYHYNYWHSPVGNQLLGGGTDGNKNAGVSRLYKMSSLTNSTLAIPTTAWNGDDTPLTISTRWIYTRPSSAILDIEADYIHVGGTDGVAPGLGFTMKGVSPGASSISFTYDFRGRPNNGTINVPITSGATDRGTMSGNPYPSAIDLKLLFADNTTNGLTEILFWDEPKNSEFTHYYTGKSGGYGVWIPGPNPSDLGIYTAAPFTKYTATNPSGSSTGTGLVYMRRYAPIGQGFVLRTSAGFTGNITLKNEYRVYKQIGVESEFRASGGGNPEISDPTDPTEPDPIPSEATPILRIDVNMNDEYARQLLLAFHDSSTDGYDVGLDGHHPMDISNSDAYFPILENNEFKPFVIQTLPYNNDKKVPLNFNITEPIKISVTVVEEVNFSGKAYLMDRLENTIKQITDGQKAELFLEPGEYDMRFVIVFKDQREANQTSEGTILKEEVKSNVSFFQNNPYKQMEIFNPESYTIKTARVYDMAGRLVINKSDLGNANKLTVNTSNLSDGVYLIKLTTSENINIDYKMIIKNN